MSPPSHVLSNRQDTAAMKLYLFHKPDASCWLQPLLGPKQPAELDAEERSAHTESKIPRQSHSLIKLQLVSKRVTTTMFWLCCEITSAQSLNTSWHTNANSSVRATHGMSDTLYSRSRHPPGIPSVWCPCVVSTLDPHLDRYSV